MEKKDYEIKIGHSVEEMTYEELLGFFEINKDKSIDFDLSYGDAYWLGRLYNEKRITSEEYNDGLKVLREAVAASKRFCRILVETETLGENDYWEFFLKDYRY